MLSRSYLMALRAESDDKLAEHEQDIRYDREPGSPLTDFDRAVLRAIREEMQRRNEANPRNVPFPGLAPR